MDEAALDAMCARLAAAVADEVGGGRSKRWRCPAELKSRILVYAGICREKGEPLNAIAARLGLVESTVARWLRYEKARSAPGFRPVAIVPRIDRGEPGEVGVGLQPLRLITPRGYTVEGLELEDLARLLQVVG